MLSKAVFSSRRWSTSHGLPYLCADQQTYSTGVGRATSETFSIRSSRMGVTLFAPAHGHPQSALPAGPSQETQLLAFSLCSWTSILSGNLGGGPISCFCHIPPLREVLGSSWQPVCVCGGSHLRENHRGCRMGAQGAAQDHSRSEIQERSKARHSWRWVGDTKWSDRGKSRLKWSPKSLKGRRQKIISLASLWEGNVPSWQ